MANVKLYCTVYSTKFNDLQQANPTTNYGNGTMYLGWDFKDPNYNELHPILEKDLSFLGSITVTSVNLIRNASSSSGSGTFNASMSRVRRADWDYATSTWTIYKTANNWSVAGGTDTTNDIDTTNQFTFVESMVTGDKTFTSDSNSVALVQDAITSRSGILRVLFKSNDTPSGSQSKRIDWNTGVYFDITYTGGNTLSAAVTGTATASITEADIVAGGKTIILTLTNETWVPEPTFAGFKYRIGQNLASAQGEANGWNAKVRYNIPDANIVRTSDTVVTITLPAFATYDITAQETITATIDPFTTAHGSKIVATPTFTVDPVGGATVIPRLRRMGFGL